MSRKLTFIFLFALLALGAVYASQNSQFREVFAAIRKIRKEHPEVLAQVQNRIERRAAARSSPKAVAGPSMILRAAATGGKGPRDAASLGGMAYPPAVREVMRRVRENPAYQRVVYSQAATRVEKDYATFFRKLDPDRADALAELLHQKAALEADSFMLSQNWKLKGNERRAKWLELWQESYEIDQAIRELLGEDYEEYVWYNDTLPERREVASFKEKLYAAGVDLAPSQEEALVLMMHESREALITPEEDPELYRLSMMLPEERMIKPEIMRTMRLEFYQDRYRNGAMAILTPSQGDVYDQYLKEVLEYTETYANYAPSPDIESHDRASVKLSQDAAASSPVSLYPSQSSYSLWGDVEGGSKWDATKTDGNMLAFHANVGSGWGSGITVWPSAGVKNQDGSINIAGADTLVVRMNAPAGVRLRFGLLESGVRNFDASEFTGVNGADGEAFRHEGVLTRAGWQVYTLPLSEMKLNGGYGNQRGNRTIDMQALRGIEVLVPGGQPECDLEIDWIKLE